MRYYLKIQPEKSKMAASKAVIDCEHILAEKGYQEIQLSNIALPKYHDQSLLGYFQMKYLIII